MTRLPILAALAALLLSNVDSRAQPAPPEAQLGQLYAITISYRSSEQSSDGSTASANGSDALMERVIAVRDDGIELEYDRPDGTRAEDRARSWQLPARILKRRNGSMLLLNRGEIEARLERWLGAAEWTREVCGRWVFTWNAFLIDCDQESIVAAIERVDLRYVDLRDGASYRVAEARAPGTMARTADGPAGARFVATMELDPDSVRRAEAESDVAVGEIMQQPVTLEAALRERAGESVSGTIEVTFDSDSAGNPWRRTKVVRTRIVSPGGRIENRTHRETVERRLVSGPSARP